MKRNVVVLALAVMVLIAMFAFYWSALGDNQHPQRIPGQDRERDQDEEIVSFPPLPEEPCDTTLETLWGATSPMYFWTQPPNDAFINMLFEMPLDHGGRLDEIEIAWYQAASTGMPDPDVYVWLSDGTYPLDDNPPTQAVGEWHLTYSDIVWFPTYTVIQTWEQGIMFDPGEKFHIGVSHAFETGDTLAFLSDDGTAPDNERSSGWDGSAWEPYWPYNFLINAVICPVEPPDSTFTIACSPFLAYATPGDPPSVKYTVDVGSILGYNLPVDLSCTPPAGIHVSFSPDNIPAPYTADVTVSVGVSVSCDDYTLTFLAVGADEQTKTCDVTLRVLANNPPVLNAIGNQKFNEGDYIVLNVSAFDLDGDSLIFTASNLPEGAHFYGGTGVFLWTPTYTQHGTYPSIRFEVSDGQGGTDSEDITIEILNYPQGDVTGDGIVNVADVVYLLNYLFAGGSPPDPLEAGNVTCDGVINIADIVYLVNYLFTDGPDPCAPPLPRFILPKSNGSVNGLVWVSVQNLSDTPVQAVEYEYSADSAVWNELVFDTTRPPPMILDLTGRTYQGSWNTDDLTSGQYWLRVTMIDSVHNVEGSESIPVVIDRNPIPEITIAYDPIEGTVFFDASTSHDLEGEVIWWEWIFCDTSTYRGSVIQKEFVPGDSCQVNLTVYDNFYHPSTSYNMLVVEESGATIEGLTECTCFSLTVQATGQIPPDSRLDFGNTDAPNPKGGRVLGPVDHHEQDSTGNNIPLGEIALYYIVEATVLGNPECCSTMQYNNMTILYDGPGGPGPNGMRVTHGGNQPFDPANPNNPQNPPANAADLDPDDYNTDCNCNSDRPTGPLEKKALLLSSPNGVFLFGTIRWIDAPGWTSADPPDFRPSGAQIFDFKMFQVINYPSCNAGCEKCIVWKAAYNKDRDRQDVTGDGNPDPPTITDDNAACP
jgi:hypothetical protein